MFINMDLQSYPLIANGSVIHLLNAAQISDYMLNQLSKYFHLICGSPWPQKSAINLQLCFKINLKFYHSNSYTESCLFVCLHMLYEKT